MLKLVILVSQLGRTSERTIKLSNTDLQQFMQFVNMKIVIFSKIKAIILHFSEFFAVVQISVRQQRS